MSDSIRPVFVVGCQRSGSTLLGSMLGGHSDIICAPESHFIVDLMPSLDPRHPVDLAEVIDKVDQHWRFRLWEYDLGSERPDSASLEPVYANAIHWLMKRYGAAHDRADAKIWVDHQPGHVRFVWRLKQHFPEAKFIHIVRDGRAVAASLMPLDWGPNEILSATRFWMRRVVQGYAAGAYLGPNDLMHVRFEDLVSDPEATMAQISQFVGVDFESGMLTSSGLKLPKFTHNHHKLVGSNPAKDRTDAWRNKLTQREIEIFEGITCDLLPILGYEPICDRLLANDWFAVSTQEEVRRIALNQFKKIGNKFSFWQRQRPYAK